MLPLFWDPIQMQTPSIEFSMKVEVIFIHVRIALIAAKYIEKWFPLIHVKDRYAHCAYDQKNWKQILLLGVPWLLFVF